MSTHSGSKDYARFDELAEEFANRYRRGERPSLQEYVDRCPEMAEEIRELFPAFIEVEQADEVRHERGRHGAPAPSVPIVLPLGQVGDYRILREVGRGGMGVVYEAEQVSLGRRVALKVLPRHVARDRMTLERFRREARSAARLHHTNIVPVFEVGQDRDIVFYAMQFIQGQGLDLIIDELARLRARSNGPVVDEVSNGRGDFQAPVMKDFSLPPAPTITDASPSPKPDLRLSLMAQSLLTGRLVGAEVESSAVPGAASTASPTFAGVETGRPDPEATARFDELGLDPSRREPCTPAPTGGDPLPPEEPPSPAFEVSSSTMLPGGTQISSIESSGRRLPFFHSVARIGRQVALGLAYAHARGVVHRDIKPSNLLLDTAGVVWITDFGLAKGDDDGLTATGDILGTLRYMAPERFRGEGDARADVYALGLTIYELLTLQPAFGAADRLRLVEQIKVEEPVRPRAIDPRIPRDLETIVLKATDKAIEGRYPTAAALAEDLRRFIDDEPIEARRASYAEQLARWARHHRDIAASLAVIAFLLVVAAVGAGIAAAYFQSTAIAMKALASENDLERVKALQAKSAADAARQTAEEQRESAVRTLYFANANPVSDALATPMGWSQATSFLMGWRGLSLQRDPRAWEWYYLQSPADYELRTLRGHRVDVMAVAVSPDGTRVASGGFDDAIRIWDIDSGKQIMSIEARGRGVLSLCWSPDGTRLVEASTDRRVRVWDATFGFNLLMLDGHRSVVRSAEWSPDGTRLASKSDYDRIRIWDASTGRQLLKTGVTSYKGLFAWSPDGSRLATWCRESAGTISIWDAATGDKRMDLGTDPRRFEKVAWSPDGTRIVSIEDDDVTKLWDASHGTLLKSLDRKGGLPKSIAWSPDGTRIASAYANGIIAIWDAVNWRPLFDLRSTSFANALAWCPDGRRLVSGHGGWNGEVKVWQVDERVVKSIEDALAPHQYSAARAAIAWSPRGARLAIAKGAGKVEVWDVPTARRTTLPDLGKGWPTALAWSGDDNRLAVGVLEDKGFVKIVDATAGMVVAELKGDGSTIRTISWSSDGRYLTTSEVDWQSGPSPSTAVILWDAASYEMIGKFPGLGAYFSPDGGRIAVVGQYQVQVLDAATRAVVASWHQPAGLSFSLCWSPDGRFLAGINERDAYVWDSANGRVVATLVGHSGDLRCLAWSPDGERLATGAADGTVRLWDSRTGTPVFSLRGHEGDVLSVAWSADGLSIASGGVDATVRIWNATRGSEIDRNPARLTSLDERIAADPEDFIALRSRADLRARLERWNESAADYERLARALASKAPLWFQAGWWSARSLDGISDSPAGGRPIPDPFAPASGADGRHASDPTRPRWYCDADDPNGYVPVSKDPPYLTTRFYCPEQRTAALAVEKFSARLWLNGSPLRHGARRHPVTLRRGWNTVVAALEITPEEANVLSTPRTGLYLRLSGDPADLADAYLHYGQPVRALELTKKTVVESAPGDTASLLLAYRTLAGYIDSLRRAGKEETANLEEKRALDMLERLVALKPNAASLIHEFATLLIRHLADWTVLEPFELKSQGGATLTLQPDGSILATGPNPDKDVYTFVSKARLKGIAGIRIEALNDARLPANGPGREFHGFFHFGGFELLRKGASNQAPRLVELGDRLPIGTQKWLFPAVKPLGDGEDSTLTVIIKQESYPAANLGRFRLSATTRADLDLMVALASARPGPKMTSETVLGAAEMLIGDARKSIAHLQPTTGLATDDLLLFMAHERLGESSTARSYLERALDRIEKDNPEEDLLPVVLVKASTLALGASSDELRILALRARAFDSLKRREEAVVDYRRLAKLDADNPEWPRRLAQLGPDVIDDWNFDFGTQGWQAENHVKFTPAGGTFLKVEGAGNDPQMTVPIAAPAGKMKLTIRARLNEPVHARLFWSTREQQGRAPYSEERSVAFELTPTRGEWREFVALFESKEALTALRLDPGGAGSRLDIDSIELRMRRE